MNNVYPSFHFFPKKLFNERKRISEKYKDADGLPIEIIKRRLPGLLKQIAALSSDKKELVSFAENLKKIEVNILASEYPYETENVSLLEKVIVILTTRYGRIVGNRFWNHFHLLPNDTNIHQMLAISFNREDENYLALKPEIRKAYEEIFRKEKVLVQMAAKIGSYPKSMKEAFKDWKVREDSQLERYLLTLILFRYINEKDFIQRQEITNIVKHLSHLNLANYKKIIVRYLDEFSFNDFHNELLKQVIARLNDPLQSKSKWQDVPERVIQKVEKWIYKEKLWDFLDGERFEYWKKHIDKIRHVKFLKKPPVAAMYFGNFVVVEFAETGNAAYFYHTKKFDQTLLPRMHTGMSEDDLKERESDAYFNHLIHNRYQGIPRWYDKFDKYMSQYKKGNFQYKSKR